MIVFGLLFPCYWYAPCIIHVTVTVTVTGTESRTNTNTNTNNKTSNSSERSPYLLTSIRPRTNPSTEMQILSLWVTV